MSAGVAAVRLLVVCLLLLSLACGCRGWGSEGHTLTALIAMSFFHPATSQLMLSLAPAVDGNISQPAVSSWPDTVRCANCSFSFTDRWHYFNTADWQCGYAQQIDCPTSGCVDSAIQNYTAQLADAATPLTQRSQALAFVVHFIGDLHQPLHGGFVSDQGGNLITGRFLSQAGLSLHSVWDTSIIATRIQRDFNNNSALYFQYLLHTLHTAYNASIAQWRQCAADSREAANFNACSEQWAAETAALACSAAYTLPDGRRLAEGSGMELGLDYYLWTLPVVETRLLQAGVRLAHVLNLIAAAWTPPQPSPAQTDGEEQNTGTVVALVLAVVLLGAALCAVVCLYRRKERLGLRGLFERAPRWMAERDSEPAFHSDSLGRSLL